MPLGTWADRYGGLKIPVQNILKKLNATSRGQVAADVVAQGWQAAGGPPPDKPSGLP